MEEKQMSDIKERRRRIAERGSDRIALITGRVQSIPPSPSHPSRHAYAKSSPPLFSSIDPPIQVEDEDNNQEEMEDVVRKPQCEANAEAADYSMEVEKASSSSSTRTRTGLNRNNNHGSLLSSRLLNSSILATEGTRAICSLMIALVVVISYVDYQLFGWNLVRSESIVASRPLYILLLMDVTIVAARMLYEMPKTTSAASADVKGHNFQGAEKLLERGLVAYQAIRGVFIDFSIYVVVVICGLSIT